jgi:hypothetical protein
MGCGVSKLWRQGLPGCLARVCRAAPEQTLDNGNLTGLRLRGNVLHHLVRIPSPVACPPFARPSAATHETPRCQGVAAEVAVRRWGVRPDLGNPQVVCTPTGGDNNMFRVRFAPPWSESQPSKTYLSSSGDWPPCP